MRLLLVTANGFPSSPIFVTMMMEGISSSPTSVLTRATRRNIPGDGILKANNCRYEAAGAPFDQGTIGFRRRHVLGNYLKTE
jgi:hypothetical protein